jgi:hypothetical protein
MQQISHSPRAPRKISLLAAQQKMGELLLPNFPVLLALLEYGHSSHE